MLCGVVLTLFGGRARFLVLVWMKTCMGGALGTQESRCSTCFVMCYMAVAISGYLDETMSCSGVGPLGSCPNVLARIACHRLAMEVDLGSGLERELRRCVRCLG